MVELRINLEGTEGAIQHPAHLHYGDISTPEAEVARLLTPVSGETGESTTEFNMLVDESSFSYEVIEQFDGHIKVHLDGDANKSTILASGNIGAAYLKSGNSSRKEIAVCKSE